MEQKDIDIYEILKGMPDGTPLYTTLCGNVEFTSVAADKEKSEAIWNEPSDRNLDCRVLQTLQYPLRNHQAAKEVLEGKGRKNHAGRNCLLYKP